MLTFTVDPSLFPTPQDAYLYIRARRAISRTMQDLRRWGFLHSRRYAYVLEFQKETQQPHFHVLCDSAFVPHSALMASWGKHRPACAGPRLPNRPAFGLCWISKPKFASALHAARYATKYLVKPPDGGFPPWVMRMGKDRRVPRFQTSRGFWGGPPSPQSEPTSTRTVISRSYADRVADCGTSINLFEVTDRIDTHSGEALPGRRWCARLAEPASVLVGLGADAAKRRLRATLPAADASGAVSAIAAAACHPVRCIRGSVGRGSA